MVYKHAVLAAFRMLFLLHSAFMLSVVKLLLKGEVVVCALNGKSWENHDIVFLNFCGNPVDSL